MFNINADTYAKTCIHRIEVIKKNNKPVIWLKIHNIQDKLDFKNMSDLTIKAIKGIYNTETPTKGQTRKYRRYRKDFILDLIGIYIHEDVTLSIILDCRTPTVTGFRNKLGYNQHDLIMTKEQSVLTKIMKYFAAKKYYYNILL